MNTFLNETLIGVKVNIKLKTLNKKKKQFCCIEIATKNKVKQLNELNVFPLKAWINLIMRIID